MSFAPPGSEMNSELHHVKQAFLSAFFA